MKELMFLGLIGVVLHYFKDWVLANKAGKQFDIKKALPMAALSTITTLLLIYLKDDIADLYVVTKFGAVILGYFGNSVFFSFLDVKKPKGVTEQNDQP
jgi:hypothetical protein